jgi:hypothetical protein
VVAVVVVADMLEEEKDMVQTEAVMVEVNPLV